jgi:hypothetical protein
MGEPRERVAAKAVQRIVDWICNGSVEEMLWEWWTRTWPAKLMRVRNPHLQMTT